MPVIRLTKSSTDALVAAPFSRTAYNRVSGSVLARIAAPSLAAMPSNSFCTAATASFSSVPAASAGHAPNSTTNVNIRIAPLLPGVLQHLVSARHAAIRRLQLPKHHRREHRDQAQHEEPAMNSMNHFHRRGTMRIRDEDRRQQ